MDTKTIDFIAIRQEIGNIISELSKIETELARAHHSGDYSVIPDLVVRHSHFTSKLNNVWKEMF